MEEKIQHFKDFQDDIRKLERELIFKKGKYAEEMEAWLRSVGVPMTNQPNGQQVDLIDIIKAFHEKLAPKRIVAP